MKVAVVVGNPKGGSRTLCVARAVARRVCDRFDGSVFLELDLIDFGHKLFKWPDDELSGLNTAVAASDILIVASPTYKGTFTGVLKAFLDRFPNNGLAGVTAIPVMTAATPEHAMSIEMGLRPLLVELGASVPTRGLCFQTPQMDRLDEIVNRWADENLQSTGIFVPRPAQVRSEVRITRH